ncbi:MAG TPA: Rieske 2Fe-2S domain-containing protein [Chloroflexota bacterium]|jgi:5,5'-dehydrodivanillate O-demethylase
MLTAEENEVLTRVGPGTPAGELLRRYWYPVAFAADLSPEQPTRFVRLLGEDLVLFLDRSGRAGLLADHCAHRGASLCYGRVEERGISCAYHGWLYDTDGNVLETPPERNDAIIKHVKQSAYPVQRYLGLYWAYLGPLPAPVIPKYDLWERKDGTRRLYIRGELDCNWFQTMENAVDPAHLQILHQEFIGVRAGHQDADGDTRPVNTTRGYTDDVVSFEFILTSYGIIKKRTYTNGLVDEHPLIFPNILRQGNGTEIRVPLDDTHTRLYQVRFYPTPDGSLVDQAEPTLEQGDPHKHPMGAPHPVARYTMHAVDAQDYMAWETQGPIADRSREHLAYSDRGVVLLRRLVLEQIERVQRGADPLGVVRDPAHAMIDTCLTATLEELGLIGAR